MVTHITALLMASLFPFDGPPKGEDAHSAALDKTLAEVSYIGEDFDDAITDWAEQAGVNLVLDWPALESLGVYSDTRIDLSLHAVSAATALRAILHAADQRHLGATYDLQDGVVTVTSQAVLDRQLEVRIYDCAAILQQVADRRSDCRCRHHYCLFDPAWRHRHFACQHNPQAALLDAIESTIAPESWDYRSGLTSARLVGDKLVIRQSRQNHTQIAQLLDDLTDRPRPAHAAP